MCTHYVTVLSLPLAERKVAMGQQWHQKCFRCYTCGRFLDPGRHCEVSKTIISITCCFSFSLQHDGQPYCNTCYNQQFGADGLRTGTSIQPRPHLDPPLSAEERWVYDNRICRVSTHVYALLTLLQSNVYYILKRKSVLFFLKEWHTLKDWDLQLVQGSTNWAYKMQRNWWQVILWRCPQTVLGTKETYHSFLWWS